MLKLCNRLTAAQKLTLAEPFQISRDFLFSIPGSRFCLNNFLSGLTPPNSTKRKRLPPCPRRKKFGNAEYKINLTRREYNFFGTISSNVVFGCLKKANHEVDFGFFLIQSSEEKSISRSEPAPRRKTPLMPAPRLSTTVVRLLDYNRIHAIHFHR